MSYKVIIQSILFMFGLADNPFPPCMIKSDEESLISDWKTVGDDIRQAMTLYKKQSLDFMFLQDIVLITYPILKPFFYHELH